MAASQLFLLSVIILNVIFGFYWYAKKQYYWIANIIYALIGISFLVASKYWIK